MYDDSKKKWNTHVTSYQHAQFLQSWEWGEFQKSLGRTIIRAAQCLGVRIPLWSGAWYWYCPRGPLSSVARTIEHLRDSVSGVFIRYEPGAGMQDARIDGSVKTMAVQPPMEWIIDTRKGYEELFMGMHQKTRYNIRLASKKGVWVRRIMKKSDFREGDKEGFIECLKDSAGRKAFRLHDEQYYQGLLAHFLPDRETDEFMLFARLYLAEYDTRIIGGALLFFFGDTAYYLHGGSLRAYRDCMAPYAIHNAALSDTAQSICRYYNLGGVTADTNHPWQGVSRFKKGFGGEYLLYPGTYDYPLKKISYALYRGGRKIHRMLL